MVFTCCRPDLHNDVVWKTDGQHPPVLIGPVTSSDQVMSLPRLLVTGIFMG